MASKHKKPHIHVIGAGVAGLSTALQALNNGFSVSVYEAAGHAGGRCRSFFDTQIERTIDNGNHLLLTGNLSVTQYLKLCGIDDLSSVFHISEIAAFPFYDLADDQQWCVNFGNSVVPFCWLKAKNRVPQTSVYDFLRSALKLFIARPHDTVDSCLGKGGGDLYSKFWEPLSIGVLSTEPETAQAALLWPVLKEAFRRGAKTCRPMIAREGLSTALINPAVSELEKQASPISFHHRLESVSYEGGRISTLHFNQQNVVLAENDNVVFAVPPKSVNKLMPEMNLPLEVRAIANIHFVLPRAFGETSMKGCIGGIAQWIFVRGDMASVTISAAENLLSMTKNELAEAVWPEVARVIGLSVDELAAYRVIIEKEATIAQTPATAALRANISAKAQNVYVAGDWTNTGLPATIEGAVRSGEMVVSKLIAELS